MTRLDHYRAISALIAHLEPGSTVSYRFPQMDRSVLSAVNGACHVTIGAGMYSTRKTSSTSVEITRLRVPRINYKRVREKETGRDIDFIRAEWWMIERQYQEWLGE